MSLTERYIDYLRDRRDTSALGTLCAELEERGYQLEARLLQSYEEQGPSVVQIDLEESAWSGLRARIGPQLPQAERAGDIWFDTCELMPMILLPSAPLLPNEEYTAEALARIPPFEAWMALRPVANWQYAAFLNLAHVGPREVQLAPSFRLLDPDRVLQGDETQPTTNLTQSEAEMYAHWFGKSVCGHGEWQAAARLLTREQIAVLWNGLTREWGGTFQEDVTVVVTPANMNLDLMEAWDNETGRDAADKIFYGEWSIPQKVGFRTRVLYETGLLSSAQANPTSFDNVQLLDVLKREI